MIFGQKLCNHFYDQPFQQNNGTLIEVKMLFNVFFQFLLFSAIFSEYQDRFKTTLFR